ncbi:MAG: baseplate J/gp47 family protein [Nostoc sp.]|uniref:baseplate J/gp47 family protein n=1 Tax=Nostoc sp. TaxID=1180 RepID=UPI002FF45EA3
MPIQLPNLDDRTYDDLVQEALSLIPTYAPEWTNHNPSDPGITLIELFAYLTEMLNYRLNRVTSANKQTFLNLISEKGELQPLDEKTLNDKIRTEILNLRKANRAVSSKDFEELAIAATKNVQNPQQKVARARCLPRRNLESPTPGAVYVEQPGHVSVVIVPDKPPTSNSQLQPTPELLEAVKHELELKRLLTTRLHVVSPVYLTVRVQITLILEPGAKEDIVKKQVLEALQNFFHPLKGGKEGKGWEFGRNVYVSEIYELLDKQIGVDYVIPKDKEELEVDEQRKVKVNGQLSAVKVNDNELVNFEFNEGDITIKLGNDSDTGE